MQRRLTAPTRLRAGLAGCAAAAALSGLVASPATAGNAGTAQRSVRVVRTAHNAKLHRRILVSLKRLTLYSLSAERHGRFICTDASCLQFWTPLTLRRGTRPKATVRSLGTVRRPNGTRQVTYRGRPLYTFNDDRRAGQVGGEGFVDVGTWHAAVVRRG